MYNYFPNLAWGAWSYCEHVLIYRLNSEVGYCRILTNFKPFDVKYQKIHKVQVKLSVRCSIVEKINGES